MDDHGVWDPDNFHWTNMTVWLAQKGWSWDMVVDVAVALVANDTSRYQLEVCGFTFIQGLDYVDVSKFLYLVLFADTHFVK